MQNINTSQPNDGLGDKLRDAFNKVNSNFEEVRDKYTYASLLLRYNEEILTSGSLVIGKTYVIPTLINGDNFTNVGYTSEGTPFTASGQFPLIWDGGTEVLSHNISGSRIFYNNIDDEIEISYDYQNGFIIETSGSVFTTDNLFSESNFVSYINDKKININTGDNTMVKIEIYE